MPNSPTTFTPRTKQKGDFILAQDWNDTVAEIARLGEAVDASQNRVIENIAVSGSVGIGTTEPPRAKLEVKGAGGPADVDVVVSGRLRSSHPWGGLWVGQDRFVGGGAGGGKDQIGFWNGNKWRLSVRPDGQVGIGTEKPRSLLEVQGSFRALSNESGERTIATEAPTTPDHRGDGNTRPGTGLVLRVVKNPNSGDPIFQVRSSGQAVRFFVDHDGWTGATTNSAWFAGTRANFFNSDVGIGTKTPRAKLEVSGGKLQLDGDQQLVFTDGDTSNNLKVQLASGFGLGINPDTLFYAANGRHSWRDAGGTQETMSLSTAADGGLSVLGTGNSHIAGSLGIGTATPAERLEVHGAIAIRATDADAKLRFEIPGKNAYTMGIDQADNAKFKIGHGAEPGTKAILSITGDGQVGIGTANPTTAMEVNGIVTATKFVGDGSTLSGVATSDKIKWVDNGEGTGISYTAGTSVTIGSDAGSSLRILGKHQDANGDALVLGPADGTHLRLGHDAGYNWMQSHGKQPLVINPLGEHVGIGTTLPRSRLHVHGGFLVSSGHAADDAAAQALLSDLPENSAILGSPSGGELVCYWKDAKGKQFRAALAGTELPKAAEPS